MSRSHQLMKNTIILGIGLLVPKLIALITLPIVTAALSIDEFGQYDLIITVSMILVPVVTLQIQQAAFRFLIASETEDQRKDYMNSSLTYLFISMGAVFLITLVLLTIFKLKPVLVVGIAVLLFAQACYIVFGQILRGLGNNGKYVKSIILYAVTNMALLLILVLWQKNTLSGVVYSMAIAYTLSSLYMVFQHEIRSILNLKSFKRKTLKELLAFSAPIVPSTVSFWIVNLSNRLIITAFLGVGMNGIFSVANKIPQLFTSGFNVFNMAWTESAARASNDHDVEAYYSSMFGKLFTFLIGFMLILITATPLLFDTLINVKYADAYNYIPILFFGVFFSSIVAFYGSIYIAIKHTKHVATSSVIGAIINLSINLCLIKIFGLFAASIALVVSYIVIALFRGYDINKRIALQYHWGQISLGLLAFVTAAAFCYIRTPLAIIGCCVITIVYNLKYNVYLLRFIASFIKAIRKERLEK